jgi:hypothetical protein
MDRVLFYSTEEVGCRSPLSFEGVIATVVVFGALGLLWAYRNVKKVTSINLSNFSDIDLDDSESMEYDMVSPPQKKLLLELGMKISEVVVIISREQRNS